MSPNIENADEHDAISKTNTIASPTGMTTCYSPLFSASDRTLKVRSSVRTTFAREWNLLNANIVLDRLHAFDTTCDLDGFIRLLSSRSRARQFNDAL